MLVVGDIGGTKTLLAFYEPGADARAPKAQKEYHSADFPGLAPIVRAFLAETGQVADHACFDIPGPVLNGKAHTTNLPWTLDEAGLAQELGMQRVILLNDLQAVATAVPYLQPADIVTLNPGTPDRRGRIAVIAPGTGLGEAFLVWGGTGYIACASEGGHASFAPTNAREAALWQYLHQKFDAVSFERVCSGLGIANIYEFLRAEGKIPESQALANDLAGATDHTPLIAQAGLRGDPLAAAVLDMFITILGAEAGNFALKIMATGGVYLAGGVPAHLLDLLRGPAFMTAFTAKGRLAPVLQAMPVHVVTVPAALFGAARHGLDSIRTATEAPR